MLLTNPAEQIALIKSLQYIDNYILFYLPIQKYIPRTAQLIARTGSQGNEKTRKKLEPYRRDSKFFFIKSKVKNKYIQITFCIIFREMSGLIVSFLAMCSRSLIRNFFGSQVFSFIFFFFSPK